MGGFSIWHWLIVLMIVLLLFGGAGKIPRLMGDVAKGVKAFKQGLKDEDEDHPAGASAQPRAIEGDLKAAEQHDAAAKH